MTDEQRLEASSRMALCAVLHDLGKFAERARLPIEPERLDTHVQLYCPRQENAGKVWYTHRHAAYTAMAFDLIERHLPPLTGQSLIPFADWKSRDVDDSLVNASARHHKPDTFLQWIVATADRVASGFEREDFDRYNAAEDKTDTGKNHYQARLLTLFEQIGFGERVVSAAGLKYRYPLKPLSPQSLFPLTREACEPGDDRQAQREYQELWDGFVAALQSIPESHRASLPLWLDHFDTLWQTFTHAIPSATAFNVKPEVPLYDHSKTTAALAVALWRYHADLGHEAGAVVAKLRSRGDWDEEKFLLIQGDFFGIQKFIFAGGGDTKKKAAKLLRGRSFYVSLITECGALRVLDALDLPSTSQIINAAGKFLIVAPNTDEVKAKLTRIQAEFDAWFLAHSFGEAGLGLAAEPAACNDFLRGKTGQSRFKGLMKRLHRRLERTKHQHFGLCGDGATAPVFGGYLDGFDNTLGACAVNEHAPAEVIDGDVHLSRLAADQIAAGSLLVKCRRLIVSLEKLSDQRTLQLPIFGYHIHFTGEEEKSGKFGAEVKHGNIRRLFDFAPPEPDPDAVLWNGYARRNIGGYLSVFADREWEDPRYDSVRDALDEKPEAGDSKTLHHIACEDVDPATFSGVKALHTLKGDIDDLGAIFQQGLEEPTFAKMAALSRQVNNFFTVRLPWLCRTRFPETYTVFAGGDDFFLIGPWKSQVALALAMREEFGRYVAANPGIHFSAGLAMTKPAVPIHYLAEGAEAALEQAKRFRRGQSEATKNAVTCFNQTVGWEDMPALWDSHIWIKERAEREDLSTSYVYGLLNMAEMAERVSERPEAAIWRSRLAYRTHRMVAAKRGLSKEQQNSVAQRLMAELGGTESGIEKFKSAYKIALQLFLYQKRH